MLAGEAGPRAAAAARTRKAQLAGAGRSAGEYSQFELNKSRSMQRQPLVALSGYTRCVVAGVGLVSLSGERHLRCLSTHLSPLSLFLTIIPSSFSSPSQRSARRRRRHPICSAPRERRQKECVRGVSGCGAHLHSRGMSCVLFSYFFFFFPARLISFCRLLSPQDNVKQVIAQFETFKATNNLARLPAPVISRAFVCRLLFIFYLFIFF